MASSVFYKFKSRKDESRVNFDGTGISVFDLKKEIIVANGLGKANDFDLVVLDGSTDEGMTSTGLQTRLEFILLQNSKMTRISYLARPRW